MARTNNQTTSLSLTGSGAGIGEVLAGLVNDLAVGLRAGETGNTRLSAQFEVLRAATVGQSEAVAQNTQAVLQNTIAQTSSSGSSGGGGIGSVLGSVFGSGLGLSPLIKGIVGLFTGGGGEPAPSPLVAYTRPPTLDYEGTITRSASTTPTVPVSTTPAGAAGTQITVQVQAMDSRSFLDHRDEIAQAVRAAMLNSHSLNDVVNDL